MKLTRAIALCALTLAIALAIGAISPMQPYASAGRLDPIIIIQTAQPAMPTPALPTAAQVEQLAAAPVEQPTPAEVPQLAQLGQVEQPATYTYQSEQLHDLSLDASAAPACDPGIESAYCSLPIATPAPAPASEYQPMTERQQQQSRQRTR